ncbi:hypothetical protein ES705_24795 [subsurface metagenome]
MINKKIIDYSRENVKLIDNIKELRNLFKSELANFMNQTNTENNLSAKDNATVNIITIEAIIKKDEKRIKRNIEKMYLLVQRERTY